jgi:hypothetical protein
MNQGAMMNKSLRHFVLMLMVCCAGCSGPASQNLSVNTPPSAEKFSNGSAVQPTASPTTALTPEERWVTTSIKARVFGPNGKPKRWVLIQPGKPGKLAAGEWLTSNGEKFTGRTSGDSELFLEAGKIKGRNVDVSKAED